jgi:hypothetical protein
MNIKYKHRYQERATFVHESYFPRIQIQHQRVQTYKQGGEETH